MSSMEEKHIFTTSRSEEIKRSLQKKYAEFKKRFTAPTNPPDLPHLPIKKVNGKTKIAKARTPNVVRTETYIPREILLRIISYTLLSLIILIIVIATLASYGKKIL
jgi:hypothetical protein